METYKYAAYTIYGTFLYDLETYEELEEKELLLLENEVYTVEMVNGKMVELYPFEIKVARSL